MSKRQFFIAPAFALLILSAGAVPNATPSSILWTAPSILVAAMLIAWAAESAQFFLAQGIALAILAWWQTLPEFAVEAVLAWRQQVPLLMANLTGSLRLITGLGWPMIYFVAAFMYRRRYGRPMMEIKLQGEHSVEVTGLLTAMAYCFFIAIKGSLGLVDAAVLIAIYAAYLIILQRMPPAEAEGINELELVPRTIVTAPRTARIIIITALFLGGGLLIYFMAEPFLASLLSIALALGVPSFVFVQWVAPFVSEFPEKVSAFYWARKVTHAPMALMNMVSSNINQWTLLAAMLPITLSLSRGMPTSIVFDHQQSLELWMTLGQSSLAAFFLIDLRLRHWEAGGLFALWGIQFVFSPVPPGDGWAGFVATHIHLAVTVGYFVWCAVEVVRVLRGKRSPAAFQQFAFMWKRHIRRVR